MQGVVKTSTPASKIMLHMDDRGGDKRRLYGWRAQYELMSFITNAQKQGVAFDVFGESCYQAYQGDPQQRTTNTKTDWSRYIYRPDHEVSEPEIRGSRIRSDAARDQRRACSGFRTSRALARSTGEPTEQGAWNTGHSLFTAAGNTNTATADLAPLRRDEGRHASRL